MLKAVDGGDFWERSTVKGREAAERAPVAFLPGGKQELGRQEGG